MRKLSLLKGCVSILLALLLVEGWVLPSAMGVTGELDGKSFVGQMGQVGKDKGDKDTFIFKDGKFHSTACDPYGFGDGAYTAKVNGDAIAFEAKTTSPTDGLMQWMGTVKGDKIEGTATWQRVGKAPVEHWLKGELKQ